MPTTGKATKDYSSTVHLRWCVITEALVQALVVVELEVGLQSLLQFRDGGVVHEIDVLVLDRAPQAFDEDVVQGTAPTVHADPDTGALQDAREFHCCELRALIGVEDVRRTLLQGLPQRNPAETAIQGVRQLPGQDVAAEPVYDGHQIHEPMLHGQVGDIGTQELVQEVVESLERNLGQKLSIDKDIPEIYCPLEWHEVLEMIKSGIISIGSHTCTHVILTRCSTRNMKKERFLSKQLIEKCFTSKLNGFSF